MEFTESEFMKNLPPYSIILLFWVLLIGAFIAGCNFPGSTADTTPTLNITQAYQTVEGRLTEAVGSTQSAGTLITDAVESTPSAPTITIIPGSPTPEQPSNTTTPNALCDKAAPGTIIDVTIPDDTIMKPDQSFTKVWQLMNAGTCTWSSDYALVWFSGEQFNASTTIPLAGDVAPGKTIEISVDMTSPETPGTYQSNWKLRNPAGVLFGIGPEGRSPFWVRIVVETSTTITPSPTIATPTPTYTPTPIIHTSGSNTLSSGDGIDLDANIINGGGEDLIYSVSEDDSPTLTPLEKVRLSMFGSSQPTLANCLEAVKGETLLVLDSFSPGTYICYQTNQQLPGWMRLDQFDPENKTLDIELVTWSLP